MFIEAERSKIIKVISGSQVGADSGGLVAAKCLGLLTGGMAPKNYRTKYGNNPLLKKYNVIESESEEYPPRTKWNVKNSDATIRFAYDFLTAGEICTLKAIKQYKKPYLDINLKDLEDGNILIFDVHDWFRENEIKVLNVAGNSGNNKRESNKIFDLVKTNLMVWIETYNKG
jgi:hypothetical protein